MEKRLVEKHPIEKFAIKFRDNDFRSTFGKTVQILAEGLNRNSWKFFDLYTNRTAIKKAIVKLINDSALEIYWLYQNSLTYHLDEDRNRLKEYLKIEFKDVYIDEEVDEYVADCYGWDNGEFHCSSISDKPYFWTI